MAYMGMGLSGSMLARSFEVALNGAQYSEDGRVWAYTAPPRVSSIHPTRGVAEGLPVQVDPGGDDLVSEPFAQLGGVAHGIDAVGVDVDPVEGLCLQRDPQLPRSGPHLFDVGPGLRRCRVGGAALRRADGVEQRCAVAHRPRSRAPERPTCHCKAT